MNELQRQAAVAARLKEENGRTKAAPRVEDLESQPDLLEETRLATRSATERAEEELHGLDSAPMSEFAYAELQKNISQYIDDLVSTSVILARRDRVDTVSATHVQRASGLLVSPNTNRVMKFFGVIGASLFGAAVSLFVTMVATGTVTVGGAVIGAILLAVGMGMVAFHLARD